MAMEKWFVLRETHNRSITALGYNPYRREILMGCEDGVIKVWEAEGAKLVQTMHEHKGWITDFLYWNDARLMLSAANDGFIIAWSAGGAIFDRLQIGLPVYCMTMNSRRHQLICGVNGSVIVFDLDDSKECGHIINLATQFVAREHSDIVRCVVCQDMRIYSGGYDQKFIVYDSSYSGNKAIKPLIIHKAAHNAGITSLILAKDNENNTWIVTGSFDKTIKIWSTEGKLVHKLDGFSSTVTGVCYVPKNKTIWAVGGLGYPLLFDPKSGDNVSDFIGTFQSQDEEKYYFQVLKYFPELNQVVASTSRRHLVVWKYVSSGCQTALTLRSPIESLCYTKKVPLLIFSGDHSGTIVKWERMQANHFMYSQESMIVHEAMLVFNQDIEERDRKHLEDVKRKPTKHEITSRYAIHKDIIPGVSIHNHPHTTILKILFVEELDIILAASEDGNIYLWGFDESAVHVLKSMKPEGQNDLIKKYSILLDNESELLPSNQKSNGDEDSVTNRVAGFICKHVLNEHSSCVTCMQVVGAQAGFSKTYLISGSWDRRICIWDLKKGKLKDKYRQRVEPKIMKWKKLQGTFSNHLGNFTEHIELACDGIITDMAYNSKRNEFAYSSSDKMVYIRRFSTKGTEMTLLNTLQGHDAEVTTVVLNEVTDKWVTGSEDGTIRIWSTSGMNECEQILSAQGPVCTLAIDTINGSIVAGVQQYIRVYDPEHHRLVQTNVGHKDAVRSIIHIPERNQYITSSWDKTIRFWNTWKMPKRKAPDPNSMEVKQTRKASTIPETISESNGDSVLEESQKDEEENDSKENDANEEEKVENTSSNNASATEHGDGDNMKNTQQDSSNNNNQKDTDIDEEIVMEEYEKVDESEAENNDAFNNSKIETDEKVEIEDISED